MCSEVYAQEGWGDVYYAHIHSAISAAHLRQKEEFPGEGRGHDEVDVGVDAVQLGALLDTVKLGDVRLEQGFDLGAECIGAICQFAVTPSTKPRP